MSDFQLKDKAILVTGGGRGIGHAIATKLGECGALVAITYTGQSEKSKEKAEATCGEIEKCGTKAMPLALDVNNEAQCKEVIDTVVKEWGHLYGLVNNAGISIDQLTMRFKTDDWDKVLNTNLRGPFMLCR